MAIGFEGSDIYGCSFTRFIFKIKKTNTNKLFQSNTRKCFFAWFPPVIVTKENLNKLIIYPCYAVHMFRIFMFVLYANELNGGSRF